MVIIRVVRLRMVMVRLLMSKNGDVDGETGGKLTNGSGDGEDVGVLCVSDCN